MRYTGAALRIAVLVIAATQRFQQFGCLRIEPSWQTDADDSMLGFELSGTSCLSSA